MSSIEVRGISPEDFRRELEAPIRQSRENKYAYQVGLKDLDFDINEEQLEIHGLSLPFRGIGQAEQALTKGVIIPKTFVEFDNTEHQVIVFDHKPVGYSGFMDCVTHSLAITEHGLFEVGRYPAMSMSKPGRYWQWFLHRRLATPEEVRRWQEENSFSSKELIEHAYVALTGIED